jgi:muconolactone D-isomerase
MPDYIQEIMNHERQVEEQWKQQVILEHLYLRPSKNGAVMMFTNTSEEVVKQLIESSPLYQFIQSIEYYPLLQQFLVITGLY